MLPVYFNWLSHSSNVGIISLSLLHDRHLLVWRYNTDECYTISDRIVIGTLPEKCSLILRTDSFGKLSYVLPLIAVSTAVQHWCSCAQRFISHRRERTSQSCSLTVVYILWRMVCFAQLSHTIPHVDNRLEYGQEGCAAASDPRYRICWASPHSCVHCFQH